MRTKTYLTHCSKAWQVDSGMLSWDPFSYELCKYFRCCSAWMTYRNRWEICRVLWLWTWKDQLPARVEVVFVVDKVSTDCLSDSVFLHVMFPPQALINGFRFWFLLGFLLFLLFVSFYFLFFCSTLKHQPEGIWLQIQRQKVHHVLYGHIWLRLMFVSTLLPAGLNQRGIARVSISFTKARRSKTADWRWRMGRTSTDLGRNGCFRPVPCRRIW